MTLGYQKRSILGKVSVEWHQALNAKIPPMPEGKGGIKFWCLGHIERTHFKPNLGTFGTFCRSNIFLFYIVIHKFQSFPSWRLRVQIPFPAPNWMPAGFNTVQKPLKNKRKWPEDSMNPAIFVHRHPLFPGVFPGYIFPPGKTEKSSGSMIKLFIKRGIWLKLLLFTWSNGGGLRPDMPKRQHHFWPRSRWGIFFFGLQSRDYTV